MESIQIRAAHIVTGAKRHTSYALLYAETGWSPFEARRQTHKLIMLHQIVNKSAPEYLTQILPRPTISRNTRQAHKHILGQFKCRREVFKRSFLPSTIDSWNNTLSESDRQTSNKTTFAPLKCTSKRYPTFSVLYWREKLRWSYPRWEWIFAT